MATIAEGTEKIDLLIGGAGFAGLALAIALKQALGPPYAVAVADPALSGPSNDARASAIVAAARRMFETIGVWDAVADEAQAIVDMRVTDSRLGDAVRPVFLRFDRDIAQRGQVHDDRADLAADEPFAHMVENPPLLAALLERARAEGVALLPFAVTGFEYAYSSSSEDPTPEAARADAPRGPSRHITVALSDGSSADARLLVAADGARSGIRERAGIATHGWDYGQSGIVTTVAHEREHGGCAEEHFLPAGPFAILPLTGRRSSIVWTESSREAERIVALPDAEFHAELERRFGLALGEIKAVGPRRAFPLGLMVARAFVADRIALVGDAAHVIHPIAGQGLNMGLKDVAALAEVIVDAARLGLDPAGALERYQRWRRFDTMAMGVATDGLNRLFSNQSDALRLVRDVGLGLVDRLPTLKRLFIREAAGLLGEVPKLLRGEAL